LRRITLQNRLGELQKFIQVVRDDLNQDRQYQRLVVVHRNISKSHHVFEARSQFNPNPLVLRQ
jgi:hypothetical protein